MTQTTGNFRRLLRNLRRASNRWFYLVEQSHKATPSIHYGINHRFRKWERVNFRLYSTQSAAAEALKSQRAEWGAHYYFRVVVLRDLTCHG